MPIKFVNPPVFLYIWSSNATPARTHLEGLSLDFRLNVHMKVGPLNVIKEIKSE